jgi:hypothetical protein
MPGTLFPPINCGKLAISLLWALLIFIPSAQLSLKFFGVSFTGAYFLILFAVGTAILQIEARDAWAQEVQRRELWLCLAWLGLMTAALVILYPVAQSGALGRGSDRDEALALGIQAILDGRYPYYERTQFGGRLTPMPGALLLGAPFHLAGSVVAQNLIYGAACVFFAVRALRGLRTRVLLAGLLTLGNVAFMQDYVTGGDYVLNAMYVAVAVFVCAGVLERPGSSKTALALAAIFLGVAICSRPVYLVAAVAVAAYAVRRLGLRDGAGFAAVVAVTAAAVAGPFALYDFGAFMPSNIIGWIPRPYEPVLIVAPAAAVAVSLFPAFRNMDAWGLLAVITAALAVVLIPGAILRGGAGHISTPYLAPLGLYGSMILAARLRDARSRADRPPVPV